MVLDYSALLERAAGSLVSVFSSLSKITVISGIQRTCSLSSVSITACYLSFSFQRKKESLILRGTFQSQYLIFRLPDCISFPCLCMCSCVHQPTSLGEEDVPWSNMGSQVKQHEMGTSKGCICLIIHLQGLIWFSPLLLSKPTAGSLPPTCRSKPTLYQNLCSPTEAGVLVKQQFP